MKRTEATVLTVGFLILVVAVASVSWQLALGVLGVGIMASVLEPPRVRR